MILKLSSSSIKQFKACRRAYQFRKVYNVVPAVVSEALETGSNYHEMLETLTKTGTLPELDSKESAMVIAYSKFILPDMPKFEPEVEFEISFGKNNVLTGRLDGLTNDGKAVIEHKTTSLSIEEYEFNLQWDEQLLTYFVATGCRHAFYTICRKPTIRQKQTETAEEFAQRCLEWYNEETYSKIAMLEITHTDAEVCEHKKQLQKMFSEIRKAHNSNNFYRNSCNCTAWGRPCEYKQICMNYDPDKEYIGFKRREDYADNKNI